MKVLCVSHHHAIASSRYLTNAFIRLGHDVKHIGEPTPHFDVAAHPERAWIPDAPSPQAAFGNWMPDVVAYMDCGESYYHHAIYANVPHIWIFDEGQIGLDMGDMALYFHPSPSSPTALRQPDKFVCLQTAYDPTIHTPSLIPFSDRAYDVVHIGRLPPQRIAILQALYAAGLKVDMRDLAFEQEFAQGYHQGRVAIIEHYHTFVPPMRFWENCAMGNVIVSLDYDVFSFLKPQGITIVSDNTPEAWVTAVKEVLQHPEYAILSQQWVQPHTYDARAQTIIDTLYQKGLVK